MDSVLPDQEATTINSGTVIHRITSNGTLTKS